MADVLLNKVINEEIKPNIFIKWLLKRDSENCDDFHAISSCNVGHIDFVTYFLNFIHEEGPCATELEYTPRKVNTPKIIDNVGDNYRIKPSLITNNAATLCKVHSSLNNSPDRFSTPKTATASIEKSFNNSYFSPVSPLYSQQSHFTPKNSRNVDDSRNKSADKYTLCLGDFFVNSKSLSKKKKKGIESSDSKKEVSRRIKPTSLCQKQLNSGFQKNENSFNFQKNSDKVTGDSIIEHRSLLVEERMKISKRDGMEKGIPILLKRHNHVYKSEIKPILSKVTHRNNINYVIDIYNVILSNKLVLNITSEIYFLVTLLLSKQSSLEHNEIDFSPEDSFEDSYLGVDFLDSDERLTTKGNCERQLSTKRLCITEVFDTIHNTVYFAVKCLKSQVEVIKLYDKSTIRLLAENERLQNFSMSFSKKLLGISTLKSEKILEIATSNTQENVCFNMDTDNIQNFPDQLNFHAFRKQRDLFYEILRIWENHHLVPDWNFAMGLGGKIRSLFGINGDPTNYMHLARLFKNQLLSSCAKGPKEKGLFKNHFTFPPSSSLAKIDADKLNLLTNRLITKQSSSGINSLPEFAGYQEFYRDFITVASNNFFSKHLCDSFIMEIVELNDTNFFGIDFQNEETEVDINTKKLYASCIQNLRLLAKFLGLVESLPYKSVCPTLPENILETHVKVREQCTPQLDIKHLLIRAIKENTVILIMPWLTTYLAMLDYVTLRLSYYTSVHLILFDIYQNYNSNNSFNYNTAVVKYCLGWLFELPHFPESEYFNFCSKLLEKNIPNVSPSQENCFKTIHNGTNIKIKGVMTGNLDWLNIIDQSILYICCPYLEEIKKLLSSSVSSSRVSVKHITPVTAVETNCDMAKKKLEQQLEDAFFSGQPASLRKTVEFVSERIASTAVKYICHNLVPKGKELAVKDLKEILLKDEHWDVMDEVQRKTLLKRQATTLAQKHLTKFLENSHAEVLKISKDKIPPSIDSLLPIDTLENTRNVCVAVTTKMYNERLRQWLNSHLTLAVFMKDFDSEIQKVLCGRRVDKEKLSCLLPMGGKEGRHCEEALSGFHVLDSLREACCHIIENDEVLETFILNLLEETYKSLTGRNDLNDNIIMNICITSFDLCLLLVCNHPSLLTTENILPKLTKIWTIQPRPECLFKNLFCPRNVKILQQSSTVGKSWEVYASVIAYLVDGKVLSDEDLQAQSTGFYSRDWDRNILENFSNFLRKFLYYSKCESADSKYELLLNFLADFCSDL